MARIALTGLTHETNSFAPMITTFEDFVGDTEGMPRIRRRDDILSLKGTKANNSPAGFMDVMDKLGHEVVPLIQAGAQPAGTITNDAFDRLTGMIDEELKAHGPFDAVYLSLHGAMVTEDYEDAETEIQRRVRVVVGDVPIVGSLDLHGNIAAAAVEEFSALVGYRTYPHIDSYKTGERAAYLMDHVLQGKPLYKAFCQLPYLISPSTGSSFTEPCVSIYKELHEIEKQEGVLSVTFMHGFILSDIHHAGPTPGRRETRPARRG